jgi:hypothetical protein
MKRILWLAGLSFALLVFGALTIIIAFAGITHRHLNARGLLMLLGNGCIAWMIFRELRQRAGSQAQLES